MRSREILLIVTLVIASASTAFADDILASNLTSLDTGEPITLAPDEQLVRKTTTVSYAKPAFGGLFVDCFPELCPMEADENTDIPQVNWTAVQACCASGNQCFWVDGEGRKAVTDVFFRCIAANTPQTELVQTSSQIADANAKRQPSSKKAAKSAKKKG